MTPPGIEPATFRLVVQCLNELRHGVANLFTHSMHTYCKKLLKRVHEIKFSALYTGLELIP